MTPTITELLATWKRLKDRANSLNTTDERQLDRVDMAVDRAAVRLIKATAKTRPQVKAKVRLLEYYIGMGSGHKLVAPALTSIKLDLARLGR